MTKKAIGGLLGYRNKKNRWFNLESGELRYYNGPDLRPSELKNVVKLVGCSVISDPATPEGFTIILPDQKTLDVSHTETQLSVDTNLTNKYILIRQLQLQATTAKDAHEWIEALKETITIVDRIAQRERTRARYEIHIDFRGKLWLTILPRKQRRQNIAIESDESPATPLPVIRKSPETTELLRVALQNHFMLASLTDHTPIIDAMQQLNYEPGDVVVWEGDIGDLFYVLEKGNAEVLKEGQLGSLGSMQAGKAFGELALVHNVPRAVTIRCLSELTAWAVDRGTFRRVVNSQESKNRDERMRFLRRVALFNPLSDGNVAKICDALQLQTFPAGQIIFRQGDTGDCFYIVKAGQVQITQHTVRKFTKCSTLNTCSLKL